jgi:hypothetical protein
MLTLYTQRLPGVPLVPLLYPNFGRDDRATALFIKGAFAEFKGPLIAVTDDPAAADALLIPHNFKSVRDRREYLLHIANLSRTHRKRIVVFWHGDDDVPVELPNTIVFRTSLYGARKRPEEIAMPTYAEDLLRGDPLCMREKSDTPTIGFCGWAEYRDLKNRVGSLLRNALVEAQVVLRRDLRLRCLRKGLSIRRDAIRILRRSDRVHTNFLIRSSYSGHRDTIRMDPAIARREYRDNLLGCDLALVVKGDGNYSYRFYEALSLGRVPLLIDTDCVLPLADRIDYDAFVLRVPLAELSALPERARTWWDRCPPEAFAAAQRSARQAFTEHLSTVSFLRHAVEIIRKTITQTPKT